MTPNLKKLIVFACLSLAVAAVLIKVRPTRAAGGDVDPIFNAGGSGTNGRINAMVVQPDGKIVIAGEFDKYNGATVPKGVIRLNPDGSLDSSFNQVGSGLAATDFVEPLIPRYAQSLALQGDGKILVGFDGFGTYNPEQGGNRLFFGILRLNPDGRLDDQFNQVPAGTIARGANLPSFYAAITKSTGGVRAIVVLPDEKILIGGLFTQYDDDSHIPSSLIRLNPDGSRDNTFNLGGEGFEGGGVGVAGIVLALALDKFGGIIVGGAFDSYNRSPYSARNFTRLRASDGVGPAFLFGAGPDGAAYTVAVQPDNGILVGGAFSKLFSGRDVPDNIERFGPLGNNDQNFELGNSGADGIVRTIAIQADGKMLIGGDFRTYRGDPATPDRFIRLNIDGTRDTTFNPAGSGIDGNSFNSVNAIAVQSDGKILVAGNFSSYNGDGSVPDNIIRLMPTADVVAFSSANYTVQETDGNAAITVKRTGDATSPTVAKISLTDVTTSPADYFTVGAPDASFNNGGSGVVGNVLAITSQPDGNTLVGGQYFAYNGNASVPKGVMRIKPDGTLDPSFSGAGAGANSDVNAIALQPDSKILIGGNFTSYDGDASAPDRIMRLNPNGSRDTSFLGTGANGVVRAIAVQPDGKILIGGDFTDYNGAAAPDKIIRLNSDGTLDTSTFNTGSGANGSVNAIGLQPNGKILIGGSFTSYNGDGSAPDNILRLLSNGTLDPTFTSSGTNNQVRAIVVQPDGKAIIGGDFTDYNGAAAPDKVLRLTLAGALDSSFNNGGDGLNPFSLVNALALQPDGAVLVAGALFNYNGNAATPHHIMRLTPSGAWDSTFNPGGAGTNAGLLAMALQPDGKVLIGGSLTFTYNGAAVPDRLIRLNGDIFVRWAAGDFSDKTVQIPIVADAIHEPDETLTLALSIMSGAASLGPPSTATLTIQDPNLPPANTVPGAQTTNEDVPVVFSARNGNQISISDPDAGTNPVRVTLSAQQGTLSLSGLTGLDFSNGFGDGIDDVNIRCTGTIANINNALNGLTFKPTANFSGAASVKIFTNDLGNTGIGGAKESPLNTVPVTVNSVNDAPSFSKGPDVAVLVNAPAQNILLWAKNVSRGAANESSQVINFIVSKTTIRFSLRNPQSIP